VAIYDVELDSVAGLQVGMLAIRTPSANQQTLAVVGGVVEDPEGPARVVAIDAATDTVTLQADDAAVGVTFDVADQLSFFAAGTAKNNILGLASSIGNFNSTSEVNSGSRSLNNDHEGFYVDDIIIGFAERGEMVTYDGGTTNATGFFDLGTPTNTVDYPQQTLVGPYQLEIRRGTEFATVPRQTTGMNWHRDDNARIFRQFDTNDRLVQMVAADPLVLQTASFANADIGNLNPIEVVGRGNGTVTPDPFGMGDNAMVALSADLTVDTTSHSVVDWGVDLQGQPSAVLRYSLDALDAVGVLRTNEVYTPLPATFTFIPGDLLSGGLPSGDGVAVDLLGNGQWITVDNFGMFNNVGNAVASLTGSQGERWIDLVAKIQATDPTIVPNPVTGSIFTADTRVAFFHTGRLSDGTGTVGGYTGGVVLSGVEILASRPVETTGTIGDANNIHEFEQGQFVIQGNFVTDALSYGIRIDAGRDESPDPYGNYFGVTDEPHLGVARNLPVLNDPRLVPGAVVSNNVVARSGTAGILFSGEVNAANEPASVVPFGRIVNNTIYGGPGSTAVGIDVTEAAGPTIVNNVFAELGTAVRVDGTSASDGLGNDRTVVSTSAFYAVGSQVTGASQTLPLVLAQTPFVNSAGGNFYPIAGTPVVDSALNQLQDRNESRVVKEAIGLAPSPIVAPATDIFGQLRADDPQQATAPGLGSNVFQDRGAIERVDTTRPFGRIVSPLDQGATPVDADPSIDSVVVNGPDARGIRTFAIQLNDVGVGIDKATVTAEAFVLSRDGIVLIEGIDYQWLYNQNTNQVLFRATSVFPLGEYLINVLSSQANPNAGVPGRVTDLANNPLRPNSVGGGTSFFIALGDAPTLPLNLEATAATARVDLEWQPPVTSVAKPVTNYKVQWVEFTPGSTPDWTVAEETLTDSTAFSFTVVDPNPADSTDGIAWPENYKRYVFRVAARNDVGWGGFSQASPVVVPRRVIDAPTSLTGSSNNQQVSLSWTAPGADPENPITGYLIEYSSDGGTTWFETADTDGIAADNAATLSGLAQGVTYDIRVAAVTTVTLSEEIVTGAFADTQ